MTFGKSISVRIVLAFAVINLASLCNKPIQEKIDDIRTKHKVPALGALIQRDEKVDVYISGFRKLGDPTLAKTSDKFHLGSDTKAMTATQIAILVQEGRIRWNSKLSEIFPEWTDSMNEAMKPMTVEMLSSHMSGITPDLYAFQDGILIKIATDPNKTLLQIRAETSRLIFESAPLHKPGTHFEYSNMNYIILGAVIEKLKGSRWEETIENMIFKPLGMSSCGFGPPGNPDAPEPDQPWAHFVDAEGTKAMRPDSNADNPPAFGPAGTVHCSMQDWAKFLTIHRNGFNGKSSVILEAEGFKKLHEAYPGQEYTYGAWGRIPQPWAGGDALTHAGSNNGNYVTAWIAPKKNLILLSVANMGGEAAVATDEVVQALLSSQKQ
ncbi:MAG: class C beta-lactamase-related serine hydrolase [Proteobacteria bacterium]|nr:MAG: class C beta-lactamase-related serine hydrolase [Pseudomonadota bacterium]